MDSKKKQKGKLKKKLTHKYRLVVLSEDSFEERFSVKLSRLNVFVLGGVFSIVLIAVTAVIIAYTPMKEYIPGYSSSELKTKAKNLVYKVDSLEQKLRINNLKIEAIIPVLKGEEKAEDFMIDSLALNVDNSGVDTLNLDPSELDSLFRLDVEREDRFSLFEKAVKKIDVVFFAPVTGTITQQFNVKEKHFAVDVVVKKGTPVKAAADGVVIFAEWTAETGYVVIIEHASGFTSVYKHNELLHKEQGDLVRSGEVIATVGSTGELSTGPHLHFELWNNGYPVNPTNFIDFE